MKIITSGRKYIDIDAFAGIMGYTELLKASGEEVRAISTAPFNQSVPEFLQNLGYKLEKTAEVTDETEFVVLDVSNPEFFDTMAELDKVTEVIDHHTGYEKHWRERLGDKAEIEFIGSVCTMIFEKIVQASKTEILTPNLCKLLVAGILDNTLNLKSNVATERDLQAAQELMKYGELSQDFAKEYFEACYAEIKQNLVGAIQDDTKIEKVSPVLPEVFGQLVVPDAKEFETSVLEVAFAEYPEWMMNLISLEDGKSYIYFSGDTTRSKLEKLFQKKATGKCIILDKFMLRKEIMKLAREFSD